MSRTTRMIVVAAGGLALIGCTTFEARHDEALRVHPFQSVRHAGDSDMLYRAGRLFQERGRYAEAIVAYRQALVTDPAHAEAHNGLAVSYAQSGQPVLAEAEFRAAIALAPDAAHLHNNLGYFLTQEGRVPEALAALGRARELDPADAAVAANIATARALPELEQAATLVPPVAGDVDVAAAPSVPPAAPAATQATAEPVASAAPDLREYRVEISNGNGASRLAWRTSNLLKPLGIERARLTNAKPYGTSASQLQYVPGAEQAARDINARLPKEIALAEVAKLERDAKVRVLLGHDYPATPAAVAALNRAKPRG